VTQARTATNRVALNTVETTLRSQASEFGSNLSVVQTRQDFNTSLLNVLETDAANLTQADINLEPPTAKPCRPGNRCRSRPCRLPTRRSRAFYNSGIYLTKLRVQRQAAGQKLRRFSSYRLFDSASVPQVTSKLWFT
jgi:hypothetical protein